VATSNNSPTIKRILVVRLGAMGDVLHTLPAAAALQARFPSAEIGWAIEERWLELLCACAPGGSPVDGVVHWRPRSLEKPLVDHIHVVNTRGWRAGLLSDETWKEARGAIRGLRQISYDVAIDFQGAWKSAMVAVASGAPVRIGFRNPREHPASVFYTRQVSGSGTHIVEQNLSLLSAFDHLERDDRAAMRQVSLSEPPRAPELPLDDTHELWANQELMRLDLFHRDFAIINPGAGWGAKCWPAESYAEVARGLAEHGVRSLVNFGPREDELARDVENASRGAAQARRYSLGELIALTRRARLFVGGDTGPMHLAAALRVPVIGIFGPTNPARNGPYGTEAIVLRSPESVTNHSRRAGPDHAMLLIRPGEVLTATLNLLQRTAPAQSMLSAELRSTQEVRRG
jgi:heptosyltransferase-1